MSENKTVFADGSYVENFDGGTVLSAGENNGREVFDRYNLIWLKAWLPLEMRSKMVFSSRYTALDVARNVSGIYFKNRKQAMAWLQEVLEANNLA